MLVELVLNRSLTENDFSIEIVVNHEAFYQGEHIEVEIIFRNLTNRRLRVSHNEPMVALFVEGGVIIEHEDGTEEILYSGDSNLRFVSGRIRRNEVRRYTRVMGERLPTGEYELVATAVFEIWGADGGLTIWSNKINLNVLGG